MMDGPTSMTWTHNQVKEKHHLRLACMQGGGNNLWFFRMHGAKKGLIVGIFAHAWRVHGVNVGDANWASRWRQLGATYAISDCMRKRHVDGQRCTCMAVTVVSKLVEIMGMQEGPILVLGGYKRSGASGLHFGKLPNSLVSFVGI